MLVSSILFVVTIAASANSIFVIPEKSEGSESELFYDSPLQGGGSSNNQIKEEPKESRRSYKKEDGLGKYGSDKQKFSENPKHNCYKTAKEGEKANNDDKVDTNGAYEVYYERKLDEPTKEEDDGNTKANKSEDVKEEEAEEQDESNEEKEELNDEKETEEVNDDSGEDDDEKNSENYGEAEEEDPYKWPFDSDVFEQYKGFDEFDRNHGIGRFGNGKYESLGGHSSGFTGGKFGCLTLGNGEYC